MGGSQIGDRYFVLLRDAFPFPVPDDWAEPDWEEGGKVHEWKNHVGEGLQAIWLELGAEARLVAAYMAAEAADAEIWD